MRSIPRFLVPVLALVVPGLGAAQTARVGAHYGVNLTEGHWEQERLGVQGEVRALGPLAVSGAFSRFLNYPGVTGLTGTAWQAQANVRLRARGKWGFASIGYGFVVLHQRLEGQVQPGTTIAVSASDWADAGVLGLELPTRYVRPFADLYLFYLLDRSGGVGANLLMGLQVPMPIR